MEKKRWDKVKGCLPRRYIWSMQWAIRKNKRGRAMGGMLMGIRKEMIEKGEEMKAEEEGIIEGSVRVGGGRWRIMEV